MNCHIKGQTIKIVGAPRQYLHFCGLKVFGKDAAPKLHHHKEEHKKPSGGKLKRLEVNTKSAQMSSRWNDGRNKAKNPIMNPNSFRNRWGNGMTCMHTMADARGAWW